MRENLRETNEKNTEAHQAESLYEALLLQCKLEVELNFQSHIGGPKFYFFPFFFFLYSGQ